MTVDLIKEAAMLASNFVCPLKDQTTQTPDVWMTNINGKFEALSFFVCFNVLPFIFLCFVQSNRSRLP